MSMDKTKSVVNGLIAVASVIELELKDGFQAADITDAVSKISGNADVKAAIQIAFHDAAGLGAEFKNLDVMSLVSLAIELVPKIQALVSQAK